MHKPVIDLADCTRCGACVDACPGVFQMNDVGYIEVLELPAYPETEVNEAIKYCPEDCIYWEDAD